MKNKYFNLLLITLILFCLVFLYDYMYKEYPMHWILADALFCSGLMILVYGLICLILNFGGFASIRYYFRKRQDKKNNKKTPDFTNYVLELQNTKVDYKIPILVSVILMAISIFISM